jgi:preprotein translocase subunit Sss1
MLAELIKLVGYLDDKAKDLIAAIGKADPTSKEYKELLENFGATMSISGTVGRTIQAATQTINEENKNNKKKKVEEK